MILDHLIRYAKGAKDEEGQPLLADPAFTLPQPVHYLIEVDEDGRCLSLGPTQGKQSFKGGNKVIEPRRYRCPAIGDRASEKQAGLLCDITPYVFGSGPWSRGKSDDSRMHDENHQTFLRVVEEAANAVPNDPALQAIRRFFNQPISHRQGLLARYKVAPKIGSNFTRFAFVFAADGGAPAFTRPELAKYWREYYADRMQRRVRSAPSGPCLTCGVVRPILGSHERKIKGIPGGKAGVRLISFDKRAFRSQGLEKSFNAPMCAQCVDAYTLGLNNLLRGEQTRHIDGAAGIAYVFWSRRPTEFDLNATVFVAEPAHVKRLYAAPYRPSNRQALSQIETDEFYVTVLSAGRGRAVVRDWIESHLPIVWDNLRQWFDDLTIVVDRDWPGKENSRALRGQLFKEFPLRALVRSLGVKKEQGYEVPIGLAGALFSIAIRGDEPPRSVLAAALGRIRATHDIPPARAALLRLTLNRYARLQNAGGYQMSERVDESQPNAAYVCGRLFAMLERIQFRALGKVNASIPDRYFGAASSAPWTVFPHLLRNTQHHLSRLRAKNAGEAINLEKDLEGAAEKLGSPDLWTAEFPLTLSLEAQGRFALGFYHQRAVYRSGRPK